MKYMGSKRAMLLNGLGALLGREVTTAKRFVDLFSGSGAVAVHVAQRYSVPVTAYDLQEFCVVLAAAILERHQDFDPSTHWTRWQRAATLHRRRAPALPPRSITRDTVRAFREWCAEQTGCPVTTAYGGHYFSPLQASWIDALRVTLPKAKHVRTTALAALVRAASQCAAAPGHTAQPFQPTRRGKVYLDSLWRRDVVQRTKNAFEAIAGQASKTAGSANIGDANEVAETLEEGDLVFVDPPYSNVQYSRFYHVLEMVARGEQSDVSGVGRYPKVEHRPQSRYSRKTESADALNELLETAAIRKARVILTFPNHACSNGLSGDEVRKTARRHFNVRSQLVRSRFSTLGGTGEKGKDEAGRAARHDANELILVLEPRHLVSTRPLRRSSR